MNLVTMLILFGQRHALLVKVYTMAHEKEHHVIRGPIVNGANCVGGHEDKQEKYESLIAGRR